MAPKRNKISKTGKEPIADAMVDCVIPEQIMFCILTRLPVKSILRFKSVCKPWCALFSTPDFKKSHQIQFASDPKNQSFIGHSIDDPKDKRLNILYSVDIKSKEKEPTIIDISDRFVVGSCNGLFCLSDDDGSIVFWNPALKSSKFVSPPLKDCGVREIVSPGFGYDADADDYKVVRIVCVPVNEEEEVYYEESEEMKVDRVEVYSVNSKSWTTIEPGFEFNQVRAQFDLIVNGNPYWLAQVVGNDDGDDSPYSDCDSSYSGSVDVFLCFDVKRLVFRKLPGFSELDLYENARFVDWNGSLAALTYSGNERKAGFVDIWLFDDGEQVWRKDHSFGPIQVYVDRVLICSKNEKSVVVCQDHRVYVFNPDTRHVKGLYGYLELPLLKIYGYTESLAYITGMKGDGDDDDDYDDGGDEEEEEEDDDEEEDGDDGGRDYDNRKIRKGYSGFLVSKRM